MFVKSRRRRGDDLAVTAVRCHIQSITMAGCWVRGRCRLQRRHQDATVHPRIQRHAAAESVLQRDRRSTGCHERILEDQRLCLRC